ncbi:lysine-rich nucleolar protein 1 isoform X1 [Talpa occidentalis]|uniref:lysine-rich nucleolar protein 1 isoform X1 n=1 Tax=Talpa occidentalis TaxID=50954 RepID=UPI00188F113D|nr:lysine-rich nucleolar protein 1 isoform X1 [Talpa occidentalis]XP_037363416.1 lysine-rich nucleolar protein 1 isoform X1 [Talpa occidentalis]XP_037363417.1 lysine-rich nucleolar protein 1 isoform X1 [Talpa occidentalis]XP_037363418.1 lysine-rich nucleolar protein 1 isoform X1 [Talpa occidentalis]XP_037363419.1 lysine-rich nucleolar protein 1 isoform X1 [Talpa occidentalis]XP_037363420.1 lysine-rich nucleolar protein 1 isoform X1 [Talpa occidentalis]XP_054549795.1 lysine-rich nucleolar prot
MITKTYKGDLSPRLPEKKKKKKVVKEPETQYSLLNSDNYFTEVFPIRATSPSKSVVPGQVPEMPPVKKKKKKKACEEPPARDPASPARRIKSPSPKKQVLGPSGFLSGEKKKKRKSLWPLPMSPDSGVKASLDPRQGEDVTRVGRKLKKHKKEKKAQQPVSCSAKAPWFCEAGDGPCAYSMGTVDRELAASGHKRKQGSPRERSVKIKKKKKICQEGDTLLGHPKLSRSVESSPRKGGGKKKSAKVEAPEYIPIYDPKASTKKKVKTKKKTELPGVEEPALKKKKKKRKDSSVVEKPQEKEEPRICQLGDLEPAFALWSSRSGRVICLSRAIQGLPWETPGSWRSTSKEPDTDLEVVLERKGNMDEAHIDQVRRKALQEEIDRESGKTEGYESKKWMGPQFGQWDTAGFENEEKKLKFLRLMGGFKNLSPSLGRCSTMGRSNMALNKKAADSLQQSLQRDYDRAMSWKYSRGAGLGFSSTPDKIFFIDRNASKSIKFED